MNPVIAELSFSIKMKQNSSHIYIKRDEEGMSVMASLALHAFIPRMRLVGGYASVLCDTNLGNLPEDEVLIPEGEWQKTRVAVRHYFEGRNKWKFESISLPRRPFYIHDTDQTTVVEAPQLPEALANRIGFSMLGAQALALARAVVGIAKVSLKEFMAVLEYMVHQFDRERREAFTRLCFWEEKELYLIVDTSQPNKLPVALALRSKKIFSTILGAEPRFVPFAPDNLSTAKGEPQQRLKIALQAIEALMKLHNSGERHEPLTAQQFLVNIENLSLSFIPLSSDKVPNINEDIWDLGLILAEYLIGKKPEGKKEKGWFITWADGQTIHIDLESFYVIINGMLDPDPTTRWSLIQCLERGRLLIEKEGNPYLVRSMQKVRAKIVQGEKALHIFIDGLAPILYESGFSRPPSSLSPHWTIQQNLPWVSDVVNEVVEMPSTNFVEATVCFEKCLWGEETIRLDGLICTIPIIFHDCMQKEPYITNKLPLDIATLVRFDSIATQALAIISVIKARFPESPLLVHDIVALLTTIVSRAQGLEGVKGLLKGDVRTILWKKSTEKGLFFYILLNRKKKGPDRELGRGSEKIVTAGVLVHEARLVATAASLSSQIKEEFSFQRELIHPFLMSVETFVEYGAKARAIMPLGEDNLDKWINAGKLSFDQKVMVAEQLMIGVSALHALGTPHRDIKPLNCIVFTKPDLHIKLADFGGLICPLNRWTTTHAYISPEGADLLEKASFALEHASYLALDLMACDIWSLGMTLCVLITGRNPIMGKNDAQRNVKIKALSPDWFLSWASTETSQWKELIPLVNRMLSLKPTDRPKIIECLEQASVFFRKWARERDLLDRRIYPLVVKQVDGPLYHHLFVQRPKSNSAFTESLLFRGFYDQFTLLNGYVSKPFGAEGDEIALQKEICVAPAGEGIKMDFVLEKYPNRVDWYFQGASTKPMVMHDLDMTILPLLNAFYATQVTHARKITEAILQTKVTSLRLADMYSLVAYMQNMIRWPVRGTKINSLERSILWGEDELYLLLTDPCDLQDTAIAVAKGSVVAHLTFTQEATLTKVKERLALDFSKTTGYLPLAFVDSEGSGHIFHSYYPNNLSSYKGKSAGERWQAALSAIEVLSSFHEAGFVHGGLAASSFLVDSVGALKLFPIPHIFNTSPSQEEDVKVLGALINQFLTPLPDDLQMVINTMIKDPSPSAALSLSRARMAYKWAQERPLATMSLPKTIAMVQSDKARHVMIEGIAATFYECGLFTLPHRIEDHFVFHQAPFDDCDEVRENLPEGPPEPFRVTVVMKRWADGSERLYLEGLPPSMLPLIIHDPSQKTALERHDRPIPVALLGFDNIPRQALAIAKIAAPLDGTEIAAILEYIVKEAEGLRGDNGLIKTSHLARTLLWRREGTMIKFYILLNRKTKGPDRLVGRGGNKIVTTAVLVHEAKLVASSSMSHKGSFDRSEAVLAPETIVTYESGKSRFITDLADGDLSFFIKKGSLTFAQRLMAMSSILKAILVMHDRGQPCRDIQPKNFVVFLRPTFRVQMIPFGAASSLFVPYASPEACALLEEATPCFKELDWFANDSWSLGMLFCELITGKKPTTTIASVKNLKPGWFLSYAAAYEAEWQDLLLLVNNLLALNPKDRPLVDAVLKRIETFRQYHKS